jgi:L-iditol 2-dehydrogenase
MKASLLESIGHLVMIETPLPEIPHPDWALVEVKATGICGSEVHAFEGNHPFRKPPAIMGHEMAGVVAKVGPSVRAFSPGDRVFVDPQWFCGECPQCKSSQYNVCPSKQVLGTAGWPGAFGDFVVVPGYTLFHLPDSLSFVQGAMIEPLSVAVRAVRRASVDLGMSVAVLGAGSIGGLICGVARAEGAQPVIAADIRPHCLDTACGRLGATHRILLPAVDAAAQIRQLTQEQGVDVVFTCGDSAALVNLGLEVVKPQGRIVLVALMTTEPVTFMAHQVIRKEIEITSTFAGNETDVRRALELAQSKRIDPAAIVTHQLPIESAQYGMELAITKKDNAIKIVLVR